MHDGLQPCSAPHLLVQEGGELHRRTRADGFVEGSLVRLQGLFWYRLSRNTLAIDLPGDSRTAPKTGLRCFWWGSVGRMDFMWGLVAEP